MRVGSYFLDPTQRLDPGELGVEGARPTESCGDRVGLGGDVVPVQRVADLEPKRVAGAEAAGGGSAGENRVPERFRVLVCRAELDSCLTRIAGAGDHDLDPVELPQLVRERGSVGEPEALDRARALHRDEAVLVGGVAHLSAARLPFLEPVVDRLSVGSVHDEQVLPVREAIDDEVVDDPAPFVGQQRVLRFSVRDLVEIVREHPLEIVLRRRPVDVDLSHVRDVERPAVGTDCPMLLDHARVLDGHLVARERHDPRAECDVARVERRALERRGLHAATLSSVGEPVVPPRAPPSVLA